MAKFTLTIELGNDAMQTTADVAHALAEIAEKIDARESFGVGQIQDGNGNTVGFWGVTK